MQRIPLMLATEGMVLARPIVDDEHGAIPICGRGIKLTTSLIERLRNRGVQVVTVEGHHAVIEGEPTLDEMLAALDRRFRRVTDDSLMMKIRDLYRAQIARSMGDAVGQ